MHTIEKITLSQQWVLKNRIILIKKPVADPIKVFLWVKFIGEIYREIYQ